MPGRNLSGQVKIQLDSVAVVAGTTDIEGAECDMAGYEGVLFCVVFGTITSGAVTSIKAQQDIATGMASAADLLGTGVAVADTDDDKVFWLDVFRPLERFVRCVVDRGTQNAVVSSITSFRYGARDVPVSNVAATATKVGGGELHVSPAEGTA